MKEKKKREKKGRFDFVDVPQISAQKNLLFHFVLLFPFFLILGSSLADVSLFPQITRVLSSSFRPFVVRQSPRQSVSPAHLASVRQSVILSHFPSTRQSVSPFLRQSVHPFALPSAHCVRSSVRP